MMLIDADVAINELNKNRIEGDASYEGLGKAKSIIMELMRHPVVNNRGKDALWIKDQVFMREDDKSMTIAVPLVVGLR